VGGGILLTWWAGFLALRRQDAVIRASAMAIAGVYFTAAMWAVIWIERQMTQI